MISPSRVSLSPPHFASSITGRPCDGLDIFSLSSLSGLRALCKTVEEHERLTCFDLVQGLLHRRGRREEKTRIICVFSHIDFRVLMPSLAALSLRPFLSHFHGISRCAFGSDRGKAREERGKEFGGMLQDSRNPRPPCTRKGRVMNVRGTTPISVESLFVTSEPLFLPVRGVSAMYGVASPSSFQRPFLVRAALT